MYVYIYLHVYTSTQVELLRARAEITREELGTDDERAEFDLDSEVEKLIAFQRKVCVCAWVGAWVGG